MSLTGKLTVYSLINFDKLTDISKLQLVKRKSKGRKNEHSVSLLIGEDSIWWALSDTSIRAYADNKG